jgi:hypothetical protein
LREGAKADLVATSLGEAVKLGIVAAGIVTDQGDAVIKAEKSTPDAVSHLERAYP